MTPREIFSEGPPVVRMPAQVVEPACFDTLDPGTTIDLTATRFLATRAVGGLLRLARRAPVRLRLTEDSQPHGILERTFTSRLTRELDGWRLCL